jgi:NAD(P)-dependent dehydrogenase (short-subunit alcohol dehydrogenase family)
MMSENLDLDGRVVIVTGAGRGLGRAHALLLGTRGARVVVNDLGGDTAGRGGSAEPAESVVKEITAAGGRAVASVDDVSTPDGAEAVVATALSEFDAVHGLVNNAGLFSTSRSFEDTSLEDYRFLWNVHFGGTFHMMQAVWPHFRAAGGGRVLNTVSGAGIYGMPGNLDYAAAKGAVLALTVSVAREAREHGILVNALAPGGFTRMIDDYFPDEESREVARRCLRPELVAPVVVWLMHPSCTESGAVFEAKAGRVTQVRTGAPEGLWDVSLTPESVRDELTAIQDRTAVEFRGDLMDWFAWEMGEAVTRHQQ